MSVTLQPAALSAGKGWAAKLSKTFSATFEPGQHSSTTPSSAMRLDQVGILDGAHAMADTRRADVVERGLDAFPAHQFAGMDGDAEPRLAGDLEGADIVLELAHALVAGHAEAGHQRMPASGGEARRLLDRFDADMAHAGDDHAALDAGLGLGARHAFAERVGVGLGRQAGLLGMVGRGEDLRIDGAVARQAGQIVVGEPGIVLFGAEQVGEKS